MGSEWQIVEKFRFFDYKIELVSKELNHLVAILHVYFCEVKINCYFFLKRKWKYFYNFNHFHSEKPSKRAK